MAEHYLQPQRTAYVYGLDAIRFSCALMVALFHFTWRVSNEAHIMSFGWVGVQVFFVISGVVIANSAATSTPYRFVRGRFLRLYPAAWIAATICFSVLLIVPQSYYASLGIGVIPQLGALARSLLLVGDYAIATSYWTLPIEIAFYAVVFLALLAGQAQLRVIARFLAGFSTVYIVVLAYLIASDLSLGWLDLGYGTKNMLLLRHGAFFSIGMYLWMAANRRHLRPIDWVLLTLALVAAGLEIACRSAQIINIYAVGDQYSLGAGQVAWYALGIFSALVILIYLSLVNAARWTPSATTGAWLRAFGLVTYPFYLTHEVIGGALLHYLGDSGLARPVSLGLAILGALSVAHLISAYGEPRLRDAVVQVARRVKAVVAARKTA